MPPRSSLPSSRSKHTGRFRCDSYTPHAPIESTAVPDAPTEKFLERAVHAAIATLSPLQQNELEDFVESANALVHEAEHLRV